MVEPFKNDPSFLFVDDVITNHLKIRNLIKRVVSDKYDVFAFVIDVSLKSFIEIDRVIKHDNCIGFAGENKVKNYNSYFTEIAYLAGNPLYMFSSSICTNEKNGEIIKKSNLVPNKVFDILNLDMGVFSYNEFCSNLIDKKINKTFAFSEFLNEHNIKTFFAYKKDRKTQELVLTPCVLIPAIEMDDLVELCSTVVNYLPIDRISVGDTTEETTEIEKGPDALRLLVINLCSQYLLKLLCDDLRIPYKVKFNIEENLFINVEFYNTIDKSTPYDVPAENKKALISDEDAFELLCDTLYEYRLKSRCKINKNKLYPAEDLFSRINDEMSLNELNNTDEEKAKILEDISLSCFKSTIKCILSNYCSISQTIVNKGDKFLSDFTVCPEESIFSHIIGRNYNIGADIKQFVLAGHRYTERDLLKFLTYMDSTSGEENSQYRDYIKILYKEKETSYSDNNIIVELYEFSAYGKTENTYKIFKYLAEEAKKGE
jgi:hypothetical protein